MNYVPYIQRNKSNWEHSVLYMGHCIAIDSIQLADHDKLSILQVAMI